MSTETKQLSEQWPDEYARLLEAYIEQPSADVLSQATSLGRLLFDNGVPPHDVAAAHTDTMQRLGEHCAADGYKPLYAARPLFVELMKAHSNAYQKQQDLNRRLVRGRQLLKRAISRFKQSQRSLRRSEENFRALAENARDAILIGTADGKYTYANERAAALTGYSVEELVSAVMMEELIAPDEFNEVKDRCRTRLAGDMATEQYETVIVRKDGDRVPVEVTAAATLWQGEPVVLGSLRDITERKRTEEALRRARDELETRVKERTAELVAANEELRKEVAERQRAESALRQSEEKIRTLVETTSDWLWELDHNGHYTYASPKVRELLGYEPEDVIGKTPFDFMPADEVERVGAVFRDIVASRRPFERLENVNLHKNGREVVLETSGVPILGGDGNLLGYRGIDRDITERKRAEEKLRESTGLLQSIMDSATREIVIATDRRGTILSWNEGAKRLLGYKPEEVVGQETVRLFHTEEYVKSGRVELNIKNMIATGEPLEEEITYVGKDGRTLSVQQIVTPRFDEDGEFIGMLGLGRDITERKRAEEALRESEEKLAGILGSVTDHMSMIDEEHNIVWANDVAKRLFGPHVVGRKCYWAYHRRDKACEPCVASKVFADGKVHEHETEVIGADGGEMAFWCTASVAARHEDGRPKMVIEVSRDITERKRAREALRESEELFRTVVAASNDAVVAIDRAGLITIFNPAAAEMFGRKNEEVIGQPLDCLIPEEYRAPHRRYVEEYFATGNPHNAIGKMIELPAMRRDGTVFPVELSLSAGRGRDQPFVLAVIRDITERKQAEESLRRQALVFENLHDGVILTDAEGRITDWNTGAERIFGYPKTEVLGRSPAILDRPEGPGTLVERIRKGVRESGQWSGEIPFARKDGREGVCETAVVPLCDQNGRTVGWVCVSRDITDRLRAEEEARHRHEELAHVTRLATMGEMATGLAHELNQPLSAILYYARGCARRLRAGGWDFDELLGVAEKVADQAQRAAAFIDRLRAFVRKGRPRLSPVDLNLVVREAVGFAEHEARENGVNIAFRLAARLRPVLVDAIQIEQVILNLLRNGIEALRETEPGRRQLTLRTSNAGNDAVACAVADTGGGFSAETASRLFDAFYTTKPEGMGMGLPISRSIIESHGGRLWATPNPGEGSTFRFTLPACKERERHAD